MWTPRQDVHAGSLQMTEEEHVRIAKRIGLIQHLPVGYYDGTGSKRHDDSSKDKSNQFNLTITEDGGSEYTSL